MRKIINLHKVADSFLDHFSNLVKVTISYIPAANIPLRMEFTEQGLGLKVAVAAILEGGPATSTAANNDGEVGQAMDLLNKHGRPIVLKDTHPRKRAAMTHNNPLIIDTQLSHKNVLDYGYIQKTSLEDALLLEPTHGT